MTILSSQYLVLCAVFAGESIDVDDDSTKTNNEAGSVFCSIMCFLFGVYCLLVFIFRDQFMVFANNRPELEFPKSQGT